MSAEDCVGGCGAGEILRPSPSSVFEEECRGAVGGLVEIAARLLREVLRTEVDSERGTDPGIRGGMLGITGGVPT